MNAFVKVSALALGTTLATTVFLPSAARAATIVQSLPFAFDFAIDGSSTSYSFGGTLASPFVVFDEASPLELEEVILSGSIAYDFEFTCPPSPFGGCALGLDGSVGIPGVGSESFSTGTIPVPSGTVTDESVLAILGGDNPFSGSISIAPNPLPLDLFIGPAGEPLFPSIAFDGSLTSTPSIFGSASAVGEIVLTYEAVPEPATVTGLLVAGGLGVLVKRRKSAAAEGEDS
ncbi:MAG: PEP-CTERM sorting domain-containing protein [Cyanobacteria bacterium J06639_1]